MTGLLTDQKKDTKQPLLPHLQFVCAETNNCKHKIDFLFMGGVGGGVLVFFPISRVIVFNTNINIKINTNIYKERLKKK